MYPPIRMVALVLGCASVAAGCATLHERGRVVSAPRFANAPDRDPELRLVAPGGERPSGGAAVRLWLNVSNPNPFEMTLSQLSATLSLEDARGRPPTSHWACRCARVR
jgi:hypothetical protein